MAEKMVLDCFQIDGGPVLKVGKAYSSPLSGTVPSSPIVDVKIQGTKVTLILENGAEESVAGAVVRTRRIPYVEPESEPVPEPEA